MLQSITRESIVIPKLEEPRCLFTENAPL